MKLYKYSGTIEELAVERGRISYIKLFDVTDFDKAPTRLEVFGALGKYIEAIEGTDAEERAAVKNLAATIKREIRNYNNRPAPDAHIICADYDGRLELVQLPDELDKALKADAADWFRDNCYLEAYNSPYDCTGQEFTNRYKLFRRRGQWFAYHSIGRDV